LAINKKGEIDSLLLVKLRTSNISWV